MADADGTCEYVLDPDDPETWGGEQGDACYLPDDLLDANEEWVCPHESHGTIETDAGTRSLCLFHLPPESKDAAAVRAAFVDTVEHAPSAETAADTSDRVELVGARFEHLDLRGVTVEFPAEIEALAMHHATVEEYLNWSDVRLAVDDTALSGLTCKGEAVFETRFGGNASFRGATFTKNVFFSNAEFEGRAVFTEAVFEQQTLFTEAIFSGDAVFGGRAIVGADDNRSDCPAVFEAKAGFSRATFEKGADFRSVTFGGDATFLSTRFEGASSFEYTRFGDTGIQHVSTGAGVNFDRARFDQRARFAGATFTHRCLFRGVSFTGDVDFGNAEFGHVAFGGAPVFGEEGTVFSQAVSFERCRFTDTAVFTSVEVAGPATITEAQFTGDTEFDHTVFAGQVDFRHTAFGTRTTFEGATLEGARFDAVDLTGVEFIGTTLCAANFESALLSRATLFDADFRGARLFGAVLGDVRIDEDTQFLGHPAEEERASQHTIEAIRTTRCCVYDAAYSDTSSGSLAAPHAESLPDEQHEDETPATSPDTDKAKSVYRALEELGRKHAIPKLQTRCFVRRQDLQKAAYKQDAYAATALEERVIAGARWGRLQTARTVLLYGESPWRVIGWSLSSVVTFALLYPLYGWMQAEETADPLSYDQIGVAFVAQPVQWLGGFADIFADSLYYSTLTYTALGFGDFQPVGVGRLVTTLETGLGAVMLALLVFILGRRAAR